VTALRAWKWKMTTLPTTQTHYLIRNEWGRSLGRQLQKTFQLFPLVRQHHLWRLQKSQISHAYLVPALAIIAADDPSTCAIYAKEKDILIRKGGNVLKGLPIKRNTSFD
jgi:hypothetical protein